MDLVHRDAGKHSSGNRIEDCNLLLHGDRCVLVLLENFHDTGTLIQSGLGISIQIGAELGETLKLTILGINQLQCTGNLLHCLGLCVAAYTGYGNTGVNSRHDTGVEKLCLQVNLSVCNRNNVGRNISGYVACLGLDDRQCSQGSAAVLIIQLCGSLQKSGMEIENISGCYRVFAQIIIDNQDMLALVHKMLTDRTSGIRSDVLERACLGSCGGNNDGIIHGVIAV